MLQTCQLWYFLEKVSTRLHQLPQSLYVLHILTPRSVNRLPDLSISGLDSSPAFDILPWLLHTSIAVINHWPIILVVCCKKPRGNDHHSTIFLPKSLMSSWILYYFCNRFHHARSPDFEAPPFLIYSLIYHCFVVWQNKQYPEYWLILFT